MKKKIKKGILYTLGILSLLVLLGIWKRHYIIANVITYKHELLEKVDEGPNTRWYDDYYTITEIDSNIFAIGEPLYWQRNYNYLIIGEDRAILIDAGPGIRDINPVVQSLTNLPYTLVLSHFHFDHVGNGHLFEKIAIVDLPYLRKRATENIIKLTPEEHLGNIEGFVASQIKIDEWLVPGSDIDLGGRSLKVIYTPGHTSESISLYDEQSAILFSGDWFTEALGPFLSNSSMEDFYLASKKVLCELPEDTKLYPAHKYKDGGGAPEPLTMSDVKATKTALENIQNGTLKSEGFFPATYKVNSRVILYTDLVWLQNWKAYYPNLLQSNCK